MAPWGEIKRITPAHPLKNYLHLPRGQQASAIRRSTASAALEAKPPAPRGDRPRSSPLSSS